MSAVETVPGFAVVRTRKVDGKEERSVRMVALAEPHAAGGARKDLGDTVHHVTVVLGAPVDYTTFRADPPEAP